MKKILIALALVLPGIVAACHSDEARAAPFVEATTSYNGASADYGVGLGLSFNPIYAKAGVENFLDGSDNATYTGTVGAQLRILGPTSLYGEGGFVVRNSNAGYRLGAGANLDLTKSLYVRAGYQRDDYGHGHSDAALAAVGVRF